MKTATQTFNCFYENDCSDRRLESVQNALSQMGEGMTRVVFGWVVTRCTKSTYEVGTFGREENVFCFETVSEGIASSTNWCFN